MAKTKSSPKYLNNLTNFGGISFGETSFDEIAFAKSSFWEKKKEFEKNKEFGEILFFGKKKLGAKLGANFI